MRQSELLSMAEIRKWEEQTMSGINDTKKTKNNMSENQAPYKTPFELAQEFDRQELRKWIAELVFNSQTVIWGDNAEIIDACKLIEDYILGSDNARL
jgi:phage-related tail protein